MTSSPGRGVVFASKLDIDNVLSALGIRSTLIIPFMQTVEYSTGKCVRITDLVEYYTVKDGRLWIAQN